MGWNSSSRTSKDLRGSDERLACGPPSKLTGEDARHYITSVRTPGSRR